LLGKNERVTRQLRGVMMSMEALDEEKVATIIMQADTEFHELVCCSDEFGRYVRFIAKSICQAFGTQKVEVDMEDVCNKIETLCSYLRYYAKKRPDSINEIVVGCCDEMEGWIRDNESKWLKNNDRFLNIK
jgi:hypothetical protein